VEWVEKTYSTQLSFLGQWRQKTRFYSPFDGFNPGIVINAGNSHVAGINWGLDVLVDDHFTLKNNAAYHTSYVEDTKSSFVLQPRMVNITELRYHSTLIGKTGGNVSLLQKVSSHFNQTVTKVAPGYGVTDFRLGVNNLADQFDITFNIENIFNRKLKLRTDDSLTVGRVYSLNLTGRF
jgi:outer membrane receptor for ferrienterochelin and colicin